MNMFDVNHYKTYMGGVAFKRTKKKPGVYETVKCRDCGRSGVTLVKCTDGHYICMDCIEDRREKYEVSR